jgi:hypothetical protein
MDNCAARLSVAPHIRIRNLSKIGPSPDTQSLASASPDSGRGEGPERHFERQSLIRVIQYRFLGMCHRSCGLIISSKQDSNYRQSE